MTALGLTWIGMSDVFISKESADERLFLVSEEKNVMSPSYALQTLVGDVF